MRAFFIGILGNLVSNVLWLALSALLPGVAIVAGFMSGFATSKWFPIFLGGGWSSSIVLAAFWYHNHKKNYAHRMLELGTMLLVSERVVTSLVRAGTQHIPRAEAQAEIQNILWKLCGVLAYRLRDSQKGATFLVLNMDQSFSLVTQVRHDGQSIPIEIQSQLSSNHGLAGQALRENRCIVLHDCLHPPKGIDWVNTHNPPRFRGRTVAPVQTYENNQLTKIGALCFDTKIPWTITQEEEDIMLLVADKIANMWRLVQ